MPQESYIVSVHNTLTGQTEDIEVSEAIYSGCRRSGWAIRRNNDRFRENEIPFSDLKGGIDGAYENFNEFRTDQNDPALLVAGSIALQDLYQAMESLAEPEQKLLSAFFFEEKSVRQVAADMGLPHMTVHYQKTQLLRKLKKLLEK